MIYLALAVICSTLVSVFMRVSEKRVSNNVSMLAANYLMCVALAAIGTGTWNLFPVSREGFAFCAGLGVVSGLIYMGSFMLLQWNIRVNGIVLSSMFMKLGVMVPTAMAIAVFHETPRPAQWTGMAAALLAILMINLEKGGGKAASGAGLVLLLIGGGTADAMSKVFEELGALALKNHFLLYTFIVAFGLCVLVCRQKKQGLTAADLGFGLLIGIPNYCSSLFLLLSLPRVPAMIAYPTYSVATIVLVTLSGVLAFGERLSRRRIMAMAVIFAALVLLNM